MKTLKPTIILIGNSSAGKTTMVQRRLTGKYEEDITTTIGHNVNSMVENINNTDVEINICDTAGQEQFKGISDHYYRMSDACIFVADVTNENSIRSLSTWKKNLEEINLNSEQILAINKIDLAPNFTQIFNGNSCYDDGDPDLDEKINYVKEVKEIIKQFPNYYFVSAKTGEGINEIFKKASELAFNNFKKNNSSEPELTATRSPGCSC